MTASDLPADREVTGSRADVGRNLQDEIAGEMPRLKRHALSLVYNQAEADDLVQDCVETALKKIDSLREPARLRGWLFAILGNLFLMRVRSKARSGSALPIDEFADNLAASVPAEDRELATDLARAMAALSPEHRQILLLVNVEGQSYQEIAEMLDIPIGTVMSRLARARLRLRALLSDRNLDVVT